MGVVLPTVGEAGEADSVGRGRRVQKMTGQSRELFPVAVDRGPAILTVALDGKD